MNFKLESLQYTILTKESIEDSGLHELYCEAYGFWKDTWKTIFTKVGSPKIWAGDDFFRQTYIPIVTCEDKIVALHCSTVFNMEDPCLKDLKYFSIFNDPVYKWIHANRLRNFMSMEFLSVEESWREIYSGLSFAEILIGLGSKIVEQNNFDAAVGVSVKAAKITEKSQKLNYQLITDDAHRGNLNCDIIGLIPGKHRHPDQTTNTVIDFLWENRIEKNKIQKSFLKSA